MPRSRRERGNARIVSAFLQAVFLRRTAFSRGLAEFGGAHADLPFEGAIEGRGRLETGTRTHCADPKLAVKQNDFRSFDPEFLDK